MAIRKALHRFLEGQYRCAEEINKQNLKRLARDCDSSVVCDLGCDDGLWTAELAKAAGWGRVIGIELVAERARLARERDVEVVVADLTNDFPFASGTFDLVHANQVIEHVSDVDHFMSEANRVLRDQGSLLLSTENGSSWHNVFAAVMGWQIFSLTNVSSAFTGIGNPLALHRGSDQPLASWRHRTIFNFRGLIEMFEVHGFSNVEVLGAGYYPLPATLGRVDKRHSHFLSVKGTKR